VGQMDEMTQQNAALVEEAAAAAESLREQAARLAEAVSVFRVGDKCAGKRQAGEPFARPANSPARLAARPSARSPATRESKPRKFAAAGGAAEEWEEF